MPYFCHQVSYTTEAWSRLMSNPQDRIEAIRAPVNRLGGRIQQRDVQQLRSPQTAW